ncbi:C-C motif chemokine 20-like [Onychostoma macrolepis]|uniref:C-C motif chemokine n=1 Tax=Onychostoma macrolepis TaxID=369639 RepID=A0A7J6DE59_9TELE|nr:C-C motif chemokine 20-like [Onychostoma macrolepis]KAF4117598.1 hypothetical protein G5714_002151 [Onychostoma macrolepis]
MKFTLFTAIFFSMGWMSIEVSVDDVLRPVNCCLVVTDIKIPVTNIVGYYIQEPVSCPVRAVVFHTSKNKKICSDPDNNWAKKAMKILDSRIQLTKEPSKEPAVCDTSTANVIPTTRTIQGITTEGDGLPGSYTMTSTISVRHILLHLFRALKSRSKKGLHKIQMGIKE